MNLNKLVAMVVAVGCLAGVASALQVQVGPGYGPYQTGSGGEFTLSVITGSGTLDLSGYSAGASGLGYTGSGYSGSFQTFCVEGAERIYPNQILTAVVSPMAVLGGGGRDSSAGGDFVSVGTGWLYMQFASGIWATGLSYDYTDPGRSGTTTSSAYLLQQAIWALENEPSGATAANNAYIAAVVSQFGSLANARAGDASHNATAYGVWALNLTYNGQYGLILRQDQLYYDGTHRVPDGGMTLALTGMALAGLAVLRRRLL